MITREQIMAACSAPALEDGTDLFRAFEAFVAIDGSRMYVSASEEFEAKRASLPPLLAIERLRGQVNGSKRGQIAAIVIRAFDSRDISEVMHEVGILAPKLKCSKMFAAELVADSMLLASEFAAAWNRSKIKEAGRG